MAESGPGDVSGSVPWYNLSGSPEVFHSILGEFHTCSVDASGITELPKAFGVEQRTLPTSPIAPFTGALLV